MGPDPAVAAVRLAVRRCLAGLPAGPAVVACSGGADSLALLAATVFEARAAGRRVLGATVDHGLQPGSAAQADQVVAQMSHLGVDETLTARVRVQSSGQGPESAAREARYAVLEEVASRTGAAPGAIPSSRRAMSSRQPEWSSIALATSWAPNSTLPVCARPIPPQNRSSGLSGDSWLARWNRSPASS